MRGYKLTEVYRIDGHLVVADSIEAAIKLYRHYMNDNFVTISNVERVNGDGFGLNTSAIIEDKKED